MVFTDGHNSVYMCLHAIHGMVNNEIPFEMD